MLHLLTQSLWPVLDRNVVCMVGNGRKVVGNRFLLLDVHTEYQWSKVMRVHVAQIFKERLPEYLTSLMYGANVPLASLEILVCPLNAVVSHRSIDHERKSKQPCELIHLGIEVVKQSLCCFGRP